MNLGGFSYVGVGARSPAIAPCSVRDADGGNAFADGLGFGEGLKIVNWMGRSIQMEFMVGDAFGEGKRCRVCARKEE